VIILIVLASVVAGLVVLGILAAIAIPVFLNQRSKAEVAGLGLDDVTCGQVADDAVRFSATPEAQGLVPLLDMTGASLDEDNRSAVRVPTPGADPAFVMSCVGTGTTTGGTTAPVTAVLFVDSSRQVLVSYVWDK
jgi:hypothetical protein